MRIKFYQVACGDAASISYIGINDQVHYIFIDSGYERTYRNVLSGEINNINMVGNSIDLWIVSHIHDDHIGGIVSYIKAIKKGEAKDIVSKWWYNPPFEVKNEKIASNGNSNISEAKSFAQGEILTSYLSNVGKLLLEDCIQSDLPIQIGDIKITVLSPTIPILKELRNKYKDKILQALSYTELTAVSEPKSSVPNDYYKKIEDFDLDKFEEDSSIENNSSIAVIVEKEGRKILWLADALPSTISGALRNLGYSIANPLKVDVVKVSHHGSRGNNSNELYNMISCNKYVFCANGENKHQLPTKECVVRILKSKNRPADSKYEFYFTHDNATLRSIFEVDGKDAFRKLGFSTVFSADELFEINL